MLKKTLVSLCISFQFMAIAQTGFIENRGQIVDQYAKQNNAVLYTLPLKGMNVAIYHNKIAYDIYETRKTENTVDCYKTSHTPIDMLDHRENEKVRIHRVEIIFENALKPFVHAVHPLEGVKNYFTVGTPKQGVTGVRTFQKIVLKGIYQDIDIELSYTPEKGFEYNFIVGKNGNYKSILLNYHGVQDLCVLNEMLKISVNDEIQLIEHIPASWVLSTKKPIHIQYHLTNNTITFAGQKNRKKQAIIIDPVPELVYASYFGGAGSDSFNTITHDNDGNIIAAGNTSSNDNIATTGAFQSSLAGLSNGFICKYSVENQLIWSTYYGGDSEDLILGSATWNNDVFICGFTSSPNGIAYFDSFQPSLNGFNNAFLAKFDSQGYIETSTYFGVSNDFFVDIKVYPDVVVACGRSQSPNLAFNDSGFQQVNLGTVNGLFGVFSHNLTPQYCSFVGGNGLDVLSSSTKDNNGNLFLAGSASSTNLAVTSNAIQANSNGGLDFIIVKLDSQMNLEMLSYFGSNGDESFPLIFSEENEFYLFGTAASSNLPVSLDAHQPIPNGPSDVYVARFNQSMQLVRAGYWGGNMEENLRSVFLTNSEIFLAGYTTSTSGLATNGAPVEQLMFQAGDIAIDAFVAKLNLDISPSWATYIGDYSFDSSNGITLSENTLYIAGTSLLPNNSHVPFSTPNALQPSHEGFEDAFIVSFEGITNLNEPKDSSADWKIFPNPTTEKLNIKLPDASSIWVINIFDPVGKLVVQKNLNQTTTSIDTENWPKGLYMISISNNSSVFSKPFLIH